MKNSNTLLNGPITDDILQKHHCLEKIDRISGDPEAPGNVTSVEFEWSPGAFDGAASIGRMGMGAVCSCLPVTESQFCSNIRSLSAAVDEAGHLSSFDC